MNIYNKLRQGNPNKPYPPFFPPLPSSTTVPTPSSLQKSPTVTAFGEKKEYDLIQDCNSFFKAQSAQAFSSGVNRWQIVSLYYLILHVLFFFFDFANIVDPGLGFGKTFQQSRDILRRGKEITELGFSVLIGPSRKGFIADSLHLPSSDDPQVKTKKEGIIKPFDLKAIIRARRE